MVMAAVVGGMAVGAMASSGGGPDIPAPDPSIGIAQRQMADLAERQQNFYEQNIAPEMIAQLKQNSGIQKSVADAQIATMQKQNDLADKYTDRYFGTTVPLQDEMIAKARAYNEPAERERMAAEAGSDVEQAAAIGQSNLQRGLQLRGIDMGSGAAISAMSDANNQAILAKAGAYNKTREVARQMGWTKLGEAAALGQGLPSFGSSSTALATGAGNGASNAGTAGINGVTGINNSVNGTTSATGGLWGNYGGLGVSSSGLAMQGAQIAAQNDPTNAIAGAAVGGLMQYYTGGMYGGAKKP